MGKKSLQSKINEEAQMLCAELARNNGKAFDPHVSVNNAVSNIICAMTFGNRFEYSDSKFKFIVSRVNQLTSSELGFLADIPSVFLWPQQQSVLKIEEFITRSIEDHEETFDSNDIRDILDMYLAEIQRLRAAGEKTLLDVDHLWLTVFDLFLAGTDTTSMTLLWSIMVLADHPEIQKRVFAEINSIVGNPRKPSYDDRIHMPYTQAFLTEVFRFRPIVPLGLPHLVTSELVVGDYHIPKGTEIVMNIMAIHHDPKIWNDPEVFKPERFLSPDGQSVVKHPAIMAFGAGRRICLGEQLAKMELFLFLTNIVQRFSLKFPEGVKPDYSYGRRISILLPNPYEVLVDER